MLAIHRLNDYSLLSGPKGEQGAQGSPGFNGTDGEAGIQGPPGLPVRGSHLDLFFVLR